MDLAIENKSPEKEQEEVVENDSARKIQCSKANGVSKCVDQVEETNKGDISTKQSESDEDIKHIQNNCEDSQVKNEVQKEFVCSVSKAIIDDKKDDQRIDDEKSNGGSNLNEGSENTATGEILSVSKYNLDDKIEDEKMDDEKSDDKSKSNQDLESTAIEENEIANKRFTELSNQNPEQIDTNDTSNNNQTSIQNTDQQASSSTQAQIREKCRYGSQCYRLNIEHKAKFSHPGDVDYNDPDNRPECPYGVLCYRKNPQHKLDYKHTQTKRKRTQNPVGTATLDDFSDLEDSFEESVDESDYDASFIDDDDDLDDDFDSDLEFDDIDEEAEGDENSEDEDTPKKKKKKGQNGKKEKKRKKS